MSKTPVSILQEMMIKELTVPTYELIHNGGGSHMNSFIYQVTCNNLTATGVGRSKKDAKHEAAKAMLETIATHRGYLQLPPSTEQTSVRTPLPPTVPEIERIPPDVPFVNAVGALQVNYVYLTCTDVCIHMYLLICILFQTLCVENKLKYPVYDTISDVGPPHDKTFTIQCEVANFKDIGIAKTKKQAKQEAAKKMLHRLNDLVPDLEESPVESLTNDETLDNIKNAKSFFISHSKLLANKKINLGVKVSDYHNLLKSQVDPEICNKVVNKLISLTSEHDTDLSFQSVEDLKKEFQDILQIIDLKYFESCVPSTQNIIRTGYIDTSPEIVEIVSGKTDIEARSKLLIKVIQTLILFLK